MRTDSDHYEAHKARQAQLSSDRSREGRDIGAIPAVVDPARRESCRLDFRRFCETYYPEVFRLGWSDDHLVAIAKIEGAVLHGGLFALAMPRGSGKSTLAETAAQWADLYGHRRYVVIIGSDAGAAESMLDSIRMELENNDLLMEDFPEVCYPVRALEGIAHRASGQLCQGSRTHISWKGDRIVMPTIPGSLCSGSIIRAVGLTSSFRGMKTKTVAGESIRPDLVIPDDPQTDESARSVSQCANREAILAGAVLGLAGPGKKIAGIMPCTVIVEGDMADRILDRSKHPEWQGERTSMLTTLPTNQDLWQQYADLRSLSLNEQGDIARATEFYRANRDAMDEGAKASWEARHNDDELSAIQHAMNLLLTDEFAFWAEYQNRPKQRDASESFLTPDEICKKTNGHKRREVPQWAQCLTAFIDVQDDALFYSVCAWGDNMTGAVIDYGTFPDQSVRYFDYRRLRVKLGDHLDAQEKQGRWYQGLERLIDMLMSTKYAKTDGHDLPMGICLIDASYGDSTDTVYQFAYQSKFKSIIHPYHGRGISASAKDLLDVERKPGERRGHYWRMPANTRGRQARHVLADVNYWKTQIHTYLGITMGDPGCLSLYAHREQDHHRLLAEHLTAEYSVRTRGRDREVNEWRIRPGRYDNHWFDCIVGCAVGAAMSGMVSDKWRRKHDTVKPQGKQRRRVQYGKVGTL